ncbi:MAG: 1,4-alpha-glucan branching protein GlgB [Methylococcaceae bacterium]
MSQKKLPIDLQKVVEARHNDPFSVLGRHEDHDNLLIRALLPHAEEVTIAEGEHRLERVEGTDLFEWRGKTKDVPKSYRLIWRDDNHQEHIAYDPYCYPQQLADFDLHLFGEGKHWHAHRLLGSRMHEVEGVAGVLFAVWAPNAERVSVVGEFNHWDGRTHQMRVHGNGVWELFIPDLPAGTLYKYEVRAKNSDILLKSDPYGRHFELRPQTATIVESQTKFKWKDKTWLKRRKSFDWQHEPMSIYEVHLGSWQRGPEGEMLNYKELAKALVKYAKNLGFTHLELMPVTEHPYDKSWGYQTTGYYAPTSRFGTPDDFRWFVDHCHQHNLGIILDWVPAHYPKDAHGLGYFDGTALYEHEDPRLGEHLDWSTLIFNFGRYEVKNFLMSSALFWLEEYHIDALRVDAVASMLYLDYSREEGEWIPNKYGGRENLEAIDFMRQLNEVTHDQAPGTLIMAEESTSWPQVTKPTYLGGLGFDLKWNMGWMNDTLRYIEQEPVYRQYHQGELTFSMIYAFTENFLLPFSHDEVVHGKQSMLSKMPGDEWQRFANLRLIYVYMFTHPGKKLLFMGCEFGQGTEWDSTKVLDWYVRDYPLHQGLECLVKELNHLYCSISALHKFDFDGQGFEWIDCHDAQNSVLVFLRKDQDNFVLVALNFTPVPRQDYQVGVPLPGLYQEIFNSDATVYSGSGVGNGERILQTEPGDWMNQPHSITMTLPPLAGVIIKHQSENKPGKQTSKAVGKDEKPVKK